MSGAWELAAVIRIGELAEHVTVENVASGYSTVVSAAESGEVVHIWAVEIENQNPMSTALVDVAVIDGTSAVTVVKHIEFQGESGKSRVSHLIGGDDPETPWMSLDGDAYLAVKSDISGAVNVNTSVWRDKS